MAVRARFVSVGTEHSMLVEGLLWCGSGRGGYKTNHAGGGVAAIIHKDGGGDWRMRLAKEAEYAHGRVAGKVQQKDNIENHSLSLVNKLATGVI